MKVAVFGEVRSTGYRQTTFQPTRLAHDCNSWPIGYPSRIVQTPGVDPVVDGLDDDVPTNGAEAADAVATLGVALAANGDLATAAGTAAGVSPTFAFWLTGAAGVSTFGAALGATFELCLVAALAVFGVLTGAGAAISLSPASSVSAVAIEAGAAAARGCVQPGRVNSTRWPFTNATK